MRPELAALAMLAVAGCATLNESECKSVDWRSLGSKDGANGYSLSRIEEHRKACSEFGLAPDETTWRDGYEEGLDQYCVVENGYDVGRRGGSYGHVCPADSERAFVSAYELGRETHDVDSELSDVGRKIDSLESRLVSKKTPDDQRADIRSQLRDLYSRASFLRRSRDRLDHEWSVRQLDYR